MSRWVVHARASFAARHALRSYLGKREDPHGHDWQIAVRVGTNELNAEGYAVDFHAVHEALATLQQSRPELAKVVLLRYFAGMTIEETAASLETSESTIERQWRAARAWLQREISSDA